MTGSAGVVKALAAAAVAIVGLIAVVLPLLGSGDDGVERAAEFVEGRLTQPFLQSDFVYLSEVLGGEEATLGRSSDWPGAYVSLRVLVSGVDETLFTWALLGSGTNRVVFTSKDAGVSPTGPSGGSGETTVQADVWVPFPERPGDYVVAVYLLDTGGKRLAEYVSDPFTASVSGGSAAPPPMRSGGGGPVAPGPVDAGPRPSLEGALPEIEVPEPVFSTPG